MSYIFITEPYISSYADIDVLLAIWRSGALHYYKGHNVFPKRAPHPSERLTSAAKTPAQRCAATPRN
jgi:hypothetical protein